MQKRTNLYKVVFLTYLINIPLSVYAIHFEFKYNTGHTYTVETTVTQEVFVNNRKSHDAIIRNYIEIEELEAQADGSAKIRAEYTTTEQSYFTDGTEFVDEKEYNHEISRDKFGKYILDDEAFMPTVRDVPIFPDRDLQPGDTWFAEGAEVLDLRENYNIEKPYRIPFTAEYKYLGPQNIDGETFHLIEVYYDVSYRYPKIENKRENTPVSTIASSYQILYWDLEKGYLDNYTEDYRIIMETSFGDRIEYEGFSTAKTTYFNPRIENDTLTNVQSEVERLGIENVTTHIAPEGLTLSIENIQFEAESANLQPYAKQQLQTLATILQQFPNNELLITGHTALAGTEYGRQILSEQRAQAVAEYLIQIGIKNNNEIYTQGKGASDPIADNDTPTNKAKNRRVEITILD